jgi:hypothetical protein
MDANSLPSFQNKTAAHQIAQLITYWKHAQQHSPFVRTRVEKANEVVVRELRLEESPENQRHSDRQTGG